MVAAGDTDVVAIVDPVEGRALDLARKHGLRCPGFTSLEQALSAARAGCSVLAEKPVALSHCVGRAIAELMDGAGLSCWVMQNRRYYPGIRSMRDAVRKGMLGVVSPVTVEHVLGGGRSRRGNSRQVMPYPILWDMAIHALDGVRFVLGTEAVSVSAMTDNPSWSPYDGATMASCSFKMADGTVFWYRGSLFAEGFLTTYNWNWRVLGSVGSGWWDGKSDGMEMSPSGHDAARSGAPPEPDTYPPGSGDYHDACRHEMMDALAAGGQSATAIEDNLHSLAMVSAAILSAERNRTVGLDEIPAAVDRTGAGA